MLHVVTVHWKDDRWVDLQLSYLRRFITTPYRVYACLNDLPTDHRNKFFYASTEPIAEHAIKLNLLAEIAGLNSTDPEDLLMFLDGDAFPVGDVIAAVSPRLKAFPMVAVQRLENNGDIQPHPSFCMTTLGFWQAIEGDWKGGHPWNNAQGQAVTDPGGNLLKLLEERNLSWHPLHLTRLGRDHPVFFGVYADLVYHHGAGFRVPWCRMDQFARSSPRELSFSRWLSRLPRGRWFNALRRRVDPLRRKKAANTRMSQEVFAEIVANPDFYQAFRRI